MRLTRVDRVLLGFVASSSTASAVAVASRSTFRSMSSSFISACGINSQTSPVTRPARCLISASTASSPFASWMLQFDALQCSLGLQPSGMPFHP